MGANQGIVLGKQLKRIANIAFCMQGLWIAILAGLYFLCPEEFYQKFGQLLSAIALVLSFAMSRIYIRKGKELEEIKTFSQKEGVAKKREYFSIFFLPYPLWVFMFLYFDFLMN